MPMKKYFPLALILLLSASLAFGTLTRGQTWLDDWAGYLLQARSIPTGTEQVFLDQNAFSVDNSDIVIGPAAYPWGFPLILAPVYQICGLKPLCLKLINLPFFALTLIAFYFFLARRIPERGALLLTAVFGLSPAMIAAHDTLLSDLPFLFFSTATLLLIDLYRERQNEKRHGLGVLIGLAIFWAFFTRTNGILLFGALALIQFLQWRAKRITLISALVPYAVFALLWAFSAWAFPNGAQSYFDQYNTFTLQILFNQMQSYLWVIADFFAFPFGNWLYAALFVFFIAGLVRRREQDAHLILYAALTYFIFVSWPYWQGLRFFFPLIPLFLYFTWQGMAWAVGRLTPRWQGAPLVIFGIVTLAALIVSSRMLIANLNSERAINGPFDEYSAGMFAFVREQTPPGSVIAFFKPRTLQLMADRSALVILDCGKVISTDYLILHKKREGLGDQLSLDQVPACSPALDPHPIFENRRFLIYRVMQP
jgi:hypothetical protein